MTVIILTKKGGEEKQRILVGYHPEEGTRSHHKEIWRSSGRCGGEERVTTISGTPEIRV